MKSAKTKPPSTFDIDYQHDQVIHHLIDAIALLVGANVDHGKMVKILAEKLKPYHDLTPVISAGMLYLRVTSDGDLIPGLSVDAQEEMMRAWTDRYHLYMERQKALQKPRRKVIRKVKAKAA